MINNVLITGGTHGNEMTGVTVVRDWPAIYDKYNFADYDFTLNSELMNTVAVDQCVRFVEEDLNRQFSASALQLHANAATPSLEASLAQTLNQAIGPKHDPSQDLVIDFHNTTANLGACLIILNDGTFEIQLARYVKLVMPEAVVLLENEKEYADFPYLCTLGKHGVMLEIGAQSHGVNAAPVYQSGIKLLRSVLDFCQLWNTQRLPQLSPVEAFRLTGDVYYPSLSNCSAMIHPDLLGRDFSRLQKGDACFMTSLGETMLWEGGETYPHFIAEVAYQRHGLAFSTSSKIRL